MTQELQSELVAVEANPRAAIAGRLEQLSGDKRVGDKVERYVAFLRGGDEGGATPCWGAIKERFEETFSTAEERLTMLEPLIAEGDERVLSLFVQMNRALPEVLAALCERAGELPEDIQRALVSLPEAATEVAESLESFGSAARQVWAGGETTKRPERVLFAVRIAELQSYRYFVPNTLPPSDEAAIVQAAQEES